MVFEGEKPRSMPIPHIGSDRGWEFHVLDLHTSIYPHTKQNKTKPTQIST